METSETLFDRLLDSMTNDLLAMYAITSGNDYEALTPDEKLVIFKRLREDLSESINQETDLQFQKFIYGDNANTDVELKGLLGNNVPLPVTGKRLRIK